MLKEIPLANPNQICELKVQDVVIPVKCAEYFVRVANFVDDLLTKVYGLPPYYNVKHVDELIGHLGHRFGSPHFSGHFRAHHRLYKPECLLCASCLALC
jgi:hypothetical protein